MRHVDVGQIYSLLVYVVCVTNAGVWVIMYCIVSMIGFVGGLRNAVFIYANFLNCSICRHLFKL